MVDRSIAYPRGIIENVLVKVDKLILPTDFIVLDYEEDKNVPIILGRPFLATGRTIIDVQKGELTMRVQDQEVKFNVFKAMKLPGETEECFHVNVVDNVVDCSVQDDELKYHPIDPSEVFKYPYAETCDVDFVGCAKILEAPPWKIRALPWCHKPSPSYSMEQDWIFMQGANVVSKQGPNSQRVKLPGFKETQWSIKRRIMMAYLEAQTQHLIACNGVIQQNFREFVKYTNGDKLDPHYKICRLL
ncbi:DNA-directed DNA polymerase [Senna tora]|uniref:DNA-directed DNA polymerase n=1 Tax=Senna tora TaxID=362788 RepID=A0A834WHN8_9FABA|nr:DNA-directed DNA polymerase [Senna tora]